MINIGKRLESVAKFVLKENATGIIDVGCDHGLLDIYLLESNNNLKIVASDNKVAPLDNARKNIEKYSFLDKIEICLKDGIKNIDKSIDTIVIAGMGSETIIDILKNGKNELKNIKRLVISSNNKYELLREKITKMGFIIKDEEIIKESDKYYITIEFIKGTKKYTKEELYFGPVIINNKDEMFYEYFNMIKKEKENILSKIENNNKKQKEILREIELLNKQC